MLKNFIVFFLLLRPLSAFCQPLATFGDLYVWARSGLNLRKTPDFKGEKILTLRYGTQVSLIEYPHA